MSLVFGKTLIEINKGEKNKLIIDKRISKTCGNPGELAAHLSLVQLPKKPKKINILWLLSKAKNKQKIHKKN